MNFTSENRFEFEDPRQVGAWWNYLYNDHTHVTIGPGAEGSSILRDPVIQQWNRPFRRLYLLDRDRGEVWCPAWAPMGTRLDRYCCSHGPADTRLEGELHGIRSTFRLFVPHTAAGEVWTWSLRHDSATPRHLEALLLFGLDNKNFMGWHCGWDNTRKALVKYAFPHHASYEEYDQLKARPTDTFLMPSIPPDSWAGRLGDVMKGACEGEAPLGFTTRGLSCDTVSNGDPVAAFQWSVTLEPGDTWRVDGINSMVQKDEPLTGFVPMIGTPESVDSELRKCERAVDLSESKLVLHSPDDALNRDVNRWMKKQITWQTRLWRNGISYPLRNILQDAAGYALYEPEEALVPLRQVTAMQKSSGYLKMWVTRDGETANHPLVKKVHDDGGIWLAICCAMGIHANGNSGLLDDIIPYADSGDATWLEHLAQALRFYDHELGSHGLVLMRDGDWTDPINGPGRGGKGESGWASMALAYACDQVAELAERKTDPALVAELRARADAHRRAVDTHLWCGDHYAYGFDDDGNRFGERRIFLNTQTWALLSGCGNAERQNACLSAIHALGTPFGPRLVAPPFPDWDPQVGRLSIKVPGFGENGSVYCHGAAFAAAALARAGDADGARQLVEQIRPSNPAHPPSASKQIPIWQPNAWFGDLEAPDAGHSTEALATGTTTWLMLTVVEELAGFQVRCDGIHLQETTLPDEWEDVQLERVVKGVRLCLKRLRDGSMELNGTPVSPGILSFESLTGG